MRTRQFWRVPGGMVGGLDHRHRRHARHDRQHLLPFVAPWIDDVHTANYGVTWVGGIGLGMVALGLVVYVFGRRSAHKVSQGDALARLSNARAGGREARWRSKAPRFAQETTGEGTLLSVGPADRC